MANMLLCFVCFIYGALVFGMAASDLSKKKYYWFGFDLMLGICMTVFLIGNYLTL